MVNAASFTISLFQVLIVFLQLFSGNAYSEEFLTHCRDRPPHMTANRDRCEGPVGELIETLLSRSGHTVQWRDTPWPRSLLEAKNGTVDLLPRHSMNKEREAFLYPILFGYRERKVYFFANKYRDDVWAKNLEDLRPYVIGVLRDSFYFDEFNSASFLNRLGVLDSLQLLAMIESNRLDVVIASDLHRIDLFENNPKLKKLEYSKSLYNGRYISIPLKSKKIIYAMEISVTLQKMINGGTVNAIYLKHKVKAPLLYTDLK